MTDKEVRAIAIKEVTYADMVAIGATEEIATAASWKARCAFEASWDCAVDKACEFIRLHIGVDMPVRLTPDGQPLAEDFFNKAEARANAAQNVVEQFKQFMEELL